MITKKDIAKLDGLLYLYALSKTSSKREVADKLGTSVDTVNKYLADLEAEMKTFLLVSNGRGTVITPEGERLLDVTSDIVKSLRSLGDFAEDAVLCKGIVRLGMPDSIADYLGSDKMFEFFEKYPDIHVENRVGVKLPDMNALEADICLDYELPTSSDLVLIRSKSVPCGLFASGKYLDRYGYPESIEDLLENHRICDKFNYEQWVDGWKDMLSRAKHVVYRTNSIFSHRSVLEKGTGIGICPQAYGRENLVPVLKKEFGFDVRIYMMAHKDTKDVPRIRAVLDYLKDTLDEKYDNL